MIHFYVYVAEILPLDNITTNRVDLSKSLHLLSVVAFLQSYQAYRNYIFCSYFKPEVNRSQNNIESYFFNSIFLLCL